MSRDKERQFLLEGQLQILKELDQTSSPHPLVHLILEKPDVRFFLEFQMKPKHLIVQLIACLALRRYVQLEKAAEKLAAHSEF